MKLFLFNHYHNGDIFASKEYVRQLVAMGWDSVLYYHYNSPKLLADLDVSYSPIEITQLNGRDKYYITKDAVYINTWIGNYISKENGVNWITYSLMFSEIFDWLKSNNINIHRNTVKHYIPSIDFSFFNVESISVPGNSIIISNGPCLSGQSDTVGFDSLVNKILERTNKNIILTQQSGIKNSRVYYTDDIIKASNGDLNEISYIAEQCDILIGRNSGPFCFMHTKNILNDSSKTLISVGNGESESFVFKIKTLCNYYFINDKNKVSVDDEIIEKIMK